MNIATTASQTPSMAASTLLFEDEFAGMSIESLCSVIDVWAKLHELMTLEGHLRCRIDAPTSGYIDHYASLFGGKAEAAFAELQSRTPQTQMDCGKRAWAIVKRRACMMDGKHEAEIALEQLPEVFS